MAWQGLVTRLITLGVSLLWFNTQTIAEQTEELALAGLQEPVEILKDEWGISHIYAQNQSDLFFTQGYSAARDRLFQFEIWRRRALGLMAEIQGEKALKHDIGARLLQFRGDMKAEMQHYHEDGEEIITSFVRGINTYINETRANPNLLPIEFTLLGIEPGYWTPEVVVSRHNALTQGIAQEIMISSLVNAVGVEKTREVLPFSQTPALVVKDGVNLADITDDLIAAFVASRKPPAFTHDDLAPRARKAVNGRMETVEGQFAVLNDALMFLEDPMQAVNTIGSNNWLISGDKTKSGFPIMSNDPHRSISLPSLRYWAHLVAPGWNVIGGGEPVLPGISIGHNEYGAWGLTIFPIDQEDLYVYEINPSDQNQYRYDGGWEDMVVVLETIPVRGQEAVTVQLKYTRHGPVLIEMPDKHQAYALRAAWLETGAAPYLASLRMNQADSWQSFREACTYSGLPGENMIWADKEGNIGWQAVGLAPIRIGWEGLMPVPGNGDYEWAGYVPVKSMPHILNPEKGYWQTANQINVPEGYPNVYSFFGSEYSRFNRVGELLEGRNGLTIDDSKAILYDELSIPARTLVPLLAGAALNNAADEKARQLLLNWDYTIAADSVPASIYQEWEKALQANARELLVGAEVRKYFKGVPLKNMSRLIRWLTVPSEAPVALFQGNQNGEHGALLQKSLRVAVASLTEKLGPDMNQWQYGQEKMHYSKVIHPLSHLLEKPLADRLNVGGRPKGGSTSTVNLSWGSNPQLGGASLRIIVDTSDWDLTVGTNTPGQSGNPDSPFYRNLYDGWAEGDFFPAYYSRDKIESVTQYKTILRPE